MMNAKLDELTALYETTSKNLATFYIEFNEIDEIQALKIAQKILNQFIFMGMIHQRTFFSEEKMDLSTLLTKKQPLTEFLRLVKQLRLQGLLNTDYEQYRIEEEAYNWKQILRLIKLSREYDFNILGTLYETFGVGLDVLSTKKHDQRYRNAALSNDKLGNRHIGAFYTPEHVTDLICRFTINHWIQDQYNAKFSDNGIPFSEILRTDNTILDTETGLIIQYILMEIIPRISLIDFSAGSGAFIVAALLYIEKIYRILLEKLEKSKIQHSKSKDNSHTDLEKNNIRLKIIKENLKGIDYQKPAIEICRQILFLYVLESNSKRPLQFDHFKDILQTNFIHGDALIDDNSIQNNYNIIIGNPPWGSITGLPDSDMLKEKFDISIKNINSFELFISLGLRRLAKNGYLCYILPRNFIRTNDYIDIRAKLVEDYKIITIIESGKPFPDIAQETIIFELKREDPDDDHRIEIYHTLPSQDSAKNDQEQPVSIPQLTFKNQIDNVFNIYLTPKKAEILKIIFKKCQKSTLSDYVLHSRGIEYGKTGEVVKCTYCGSYTSRPRKKKKKKNCPECGKKIENKEKNVYWIISEKKTASHKQPIFIGNQVGRYKIESPRYLDLKVPGISYKSHDLFENKKIVVMKISESIKAALDMDGYYTTQALYMLNQKKGTKYDLEVLLGLLNSKLMGFIYENLFNIGASLTTNVTLKNILRLPIPSDIQTPGIIKNIVLLLLKLGKSNESRDLVTFRFFDEKVLDVIIFEEIFNSELVKDGFYSKDENFASKISSIFRNRSIQNSTSSEYYEIMEKIRNNKEINEIRKKILALDLIREIKIPEIQ